MTAVLGRGHSTIDARPPSDPADVLDRDQDERDTLVNPVPVDTLDRSHRTTDDQQQCAPVDSLGQDHATSDVHPRSELADSLDRSQRRIAIQRRLAPVIPPAGVQGELDNHGLSGASSTPPRGGATILTISKSPSPRPLEFAELRLLAESFEDAQKARIAIDNRLRSGTDAGPVSEALAALEHAEKKLGLAMRRSFRKAAPEVHLWAKETPGIGEHLVARLLGCIGHPVIASPYHWEGEGSDRVLVADPPFARTVSQLWSYCGNGDATRKKRKGMTADEAMALGNPRAKMLVHLIAEGAMKCVGSANAPAQPNALSPADTSFVPPVGPPVPIPQAEEQLEAGGGSTADAPSKSLPTRRRSPYRDVYDLARITYADRLDAEGKPWTLAHQHNAALRLVGKAFLRDLWLAAA